MLILLIILSIVARFSLAYSQRSCNRFVEHAFTVVDYTWPTDSAREDAIMDGTFIQTNNIISGMNIYKDSVFVTVPRWRLGVPSTLNKIVVKDGVSVLQPYPNWGYQTIGDCHALQYVQSVAIDPNTGWMWIIDNGRINIFAADGTPTRNLCPPKIIIYDIDKDEEIDFYEFPDSVANRNRTFLNDIVIQYHGGKARYAYITDDFEGRLVVYDRKKSMSHFYSHPSMFPVIDNITISNEWIEVNDGINGIALSSDMKYIYYGRLSGFDLYQVPTKVVSKPGKDLHSFVRKVGDKPAHADGMTYGFDDSIYFGGQGDNAVYRWDIEKDRQDQDTTFDLVEMNTVETFIVNPSCINFVDTLNLDQKKNLWFSVNKLHKFLLGTMDFSGTSGPNVLIMKVPAGTTSYLSGRRKRKQYKEDC
ncbi:protein yellow-like [Argopecten irradians]|uniref:protein yellow-like n=1 Tax=Argopecten irradians TaxID=31199 RepID=UPI0037174E4E